MSFIQAQGRKKTCWKFRKSHILKDSSTKCDGLIIQEQSDIYWKDSFMTGSNDWTLGDPKFSMKMIFKEIIFIQIKTLLSKGGEFGNISVIIQGGQAGPHENRVFRKFLDDYCNTKVWKWQPQAPQMPHANMLDLSIF